MGCKQLQLNNFFRFSEPEGINRSNFRFVESEDGSPALQPKKNINHSPLIINNYFPVITDPKGRQTTFTYDALGRQLTRTLPMGQTEHKVYNSLGQLETETDFKGIVTEFIYDNFGRLTEKTYTDPSTGVTDSVTFTYDALGRQSTVTDSRGTTTYSYNSQNSLIKISTPEGEIHYEYDAVTGRKTRTYSANTDTAYTYDELGRLKTVTDKDGNTTTYDYTAVGSRSAVSLPNGVTTQYTYDDLNRLTELVNKDSNKTLSSYTYTLAPNGLRTGVLEKTLNDDTSTYTERTITYTYDDLKRLVREESTASTSSTLTYTDEYVYDLVGNRLKKTHTSVSSVQSVAYSYNDNDQLIEETSSTDGTTTYTYDANGSLISKSNTTTGENYAYTYNLQNRLASATITRTEKDELGTPKLVEITANYAYNINGIRVVSNTTTTIDGGTSETKNRTYLLDKLYGTGS